MPAVPGARRSKSSASLPVTSDSGRSYARHVSLRNQSIAAAASDCAISSWQPSPVARARNTPASNPSAPNTGPALMPIETCSGMYANPSSSVLGSTMPAHAS